MFAISRVNKKYATKLNKLAPLLGLQDEDPQTQTLRALNDFVFQDARVSSSMVCNLWTPYTHTGQRLDRTKINIYTFTLTFVA